jgi:hypothetical protein
MLAHMVADEPVKYDAGAVRLAADGTPGGLVVVVEPSACWTVPPSTSLNIGDHHQHGSGGGHRAGQHSGVEGSFFEIGGMSAAKCFTCDCSRDR